MNWGDTSVLVTGGTGSFGRRFVASMMRQFHPRQLTVFSRDELKQHDMQRQYAGTGGPIRFMVGDVRDAARVDRALAGIDLVVHAAALKQVPACENNPFEAVQTNVLGTKNVVDAAVDRGVRRLMAISTDKAVNPVNLYGATKLCAEKIVIQGNTWAPPGTGFSCSRYGNVLGSRGSVVPIFLGQRNTGTLTVTDPRMTRFWITLDRAVEFVIRSIERMRGGEIFVPKLPSVNVLDLARVIAPTCRVEYIGIRPGEKLHEVLICRDEAHQAVELDDAYVVRPTYSPKANREYGRRVVDGFEYSSDASAQRLSPSDLACLMEDDEIALPPASEVRFASRAVPAGRIAPRPLNDALNPATVAAGRGAP